KPGRGGQPEQPALRVVVEAISSAERPDDLADESPLIEGTADGVALGVLDQDVCGFRIAGGRLVGPLEGLDQSVAQALLAEGGKLFVPDGEHGLVWSLARPCAAPAACAAQARGPAG